MTRIIIDWDDVLFPTVKNVVKLYNEQFNDNLDYQDIDMWDLTHRFPNSTKSIMELFSEIDFLDISIYSGVVDSMKRLNEIADVRICTATTFDYLPTLGNKFKAFQHYFPFLKPYQFSSFRDKHLINVDYFIDDYPHLGTALKECGSKAEHLMINRPWNASTECGTRFNSFNEAVDYIINNIT